MPVQDELEQPSLATRLMYLIKNPRSWYHLAAFNAAGKDLSLDTWLNGVANTGLIKSAGTYLMRTTATRRDGAGAVRNGDWDAAGKRFKPVTGDVPV